MQKEWFASWFDTSYYHILYKNRNDEEAKNFIDRLAGHLDLPKESNVLDLACGAGRHARMLRRHYATVLGVDLSANSIQTANEQTTDGLSFQVHDMREVIPNEQFDGIFNLFTSFGYFEKTSDNLTMLESIHEMLTPKGKLIIDFMNAEKVIKNLVSSEIKTMENIDFKIKRSFDGQHILKNIQFTADEKNWDFTEKVQGLKMKDFNALLNEANLEIESTFGDYNLSPFDVEQSNRLIIIAKRK